MKSAVTPPPEPGHRDTVVGGVRWHSREAPGTGTPILYVHGHLASSATWEGVLLAASAGHPAIAVDVPGFGASDRPWPYDYTVAGEAESLVAYLDARGIERAILVGNSLGGAAVLLVAARHPERVAALVLVAPATPEAPIAWPARMMRTPVIGEVALALANRLLAAHGLRSWLFARSDRVTAHVVDDAWKPMTIPGTRRAALEAIRSDPRPHLGVERRVRVPTLIVWGAEDRLIPASDASRVQANIAGSRLVLIPDAGHLPQREQPEAFARAVADFVARF
jgi:pimeloyl-ACP methyl ester carboxylesterase